MSRDYRFWQTVPSINYSCTKKRYFLCSRLIVFLQVSSARRLFLSDVCWTWRYRLLVQLCCMACKSV